MLFPARVHGLSPWHDSLDNSYDRPVPNRRRSIDPGSVALGMRPCLYYSGSVQQAHMPSDACSALTAIVYVFVSSLVRDKASSSRL